MNRLKLLPVRAALALLVATSASANAASVSPIGPITLTGSTTLTKSGIAVSCATTMVGNIWSPGGIKISSFKFTGNSLCSLITPAALPWWGQVLSPTKLLFGGVAVDTTSGNCGPSIVIASLTENSTLQESIVGLTDQALSGGCTVSGTLTMTPYITVH